MKNGLLDKHKCALAKCGGINIKVGFSCFKIQFYVLNNFFEFFFIFTTTKKTLPNIHVTNFQDLKSQ